MATNSLEPVAFAAMQGAAPESHEWLKRRQRIYWYDQYALNEQETAFANYDPDRIAKELAKVSAEIIAVYAANQFSVAYYPSKVWPMHPNLKGRDYFGEVSSRLKAQGQKVIGYINWLESRHPDWYVVPISGETEKEFPLATWAQPDVPDWRVQKVPGGKWRFACINSPRRAQVVAVTREIIERYRPDGFHLDMFFNAEVCVCEYCRPTLESICGTKEITQEAINAHWREFVDWRCTCSSSLIAEVSAILRENGVFAAHNGQNPLFMSPIYGFDKDLVPLLDLYVSEIFSSLHHSDLTMRWHHAIKKPSCELLTSTIPNFAHLSRTPQTWKVAAASAKANGCSVLGPCGVGAYPDTTSSPRLLDTVKGGLDFFMQDADLHDGAVSVAKVALVFSWATRKYFRHGRMDWSEELDGWARVLIEEHLPFDVVIAEDIASPDDLARYDLVILANNAFLTDAFCNAIETYAHAGGRVLATGETSLGDERGFERADFALGSLLGITRKEASEGLFAIDGGGEAEHAAGVFQHVEVTGEVLARYMPVDPAGSVSGCVDPLPLAPTNWPVAVTRQTGKGHVLYVAYGLARNYVTLGLEHIRDRMALCIDRLLHKRQVIVNAPRFVEVSVWRQAQPERMIFHIANRTQLPHDIPAIREIPKVTDIELQFESPYAMPRVTGRGIQMTSAFVNGVVTARIHKLETYTAIVVEPADNH